MDIGSPLHRRISGPSGSVLIEFSLGFSLFALIVFSICNLAIFFWQAAATQYVLVKEARQSLTASELRTLTPATLIARTRARAAALGLDSGNWDITICRVQSPDCSDPDLGGGLDLLLFKADPKLTLMGGTVPLNFKASVVVGREPAS